MKSFVLTLCTASLLGGFSAMLAGNTFGKYIKFIASLSCTLILLMPFSDLKNIEEYGSIGDVAEIIDSTRTLASSEVEAEAFRMAEDYIAESIYSRFGISVQSVSILFDGAAAKAIIYAEGVDETLHDGVTRYVKECFKMEAEIYAA